MKFTETEYAFLKEEFGLSETDVAALSEDELYDLGDKCFEIETEETVAAADGELSDRGATAAALVTKIND